MLTSIEGAVERGDTRCFISGMNKDDDRIIDLHRGLHERRVSKADNIY